MGEISSGNRRPVSSQVHFLSPWVDPIPLILSERGCCLSMVIHLPLLGVIERVWLLLSYFYIFPPMIFCLLVLWWYYLWRHGLGLPLWGFLASPRGCTNLGVALVANLPCVNILGCEYSIIGISGNSLWGPLWILWWWCTVLGLGMSQTEVSRTGEPCYWDCIWRTKMCLCLCVLCRILTWGVWENQKSRLSWYRLIRTYWRCSRVI